MGNKTFFDLFAFKSKAQLEMERQALNKLMFPYGERQEERVRALLSELLPKEDQVIAMMGFLTAKESYLEGLKTSPGRAIELMELKMEKSRGFLKKKTQKVYMALVLADAQVGEELAYPTAQEILQGTLSMK